MAGCFLKMSWVYIMDELMLMLISRVLLVAFLFEFRLLFVELIFEGSSQICSTTISCRKR